MYQIQKVDIYYEIPIRRCLESPGKESFVNGTGQNHRVIQLWPISSVTGSA